MAVFGQCSIISFFLLISSFVSAQQEVYIVQQKDSLEKIAQDKLQDARLWPQLAKYNRIPDPNLIKTGQRIVIPTREQLLLKTKEQDNFKDRLEVIERYLSQLQVFSHQILFEENFENHQL